MASQETRTIERAIRDGLVTLSGPVPKQYGHRRMWDVIITDTTSGETTSKTFPTESKALGWLAVVYVDTHPRPVGRPRKPVEVTGCSVLDDPEDIAATGGFMQVDPDRPSSIYSGISATDAARHGQEIQAVPAGVNSGKFRLRSVKDALTSEGLDPSVEIARALAAKQPVIVPGSKPDPETGERPLLTDAETGELVMVPVLDPETRVKTSLALLEFIEPKKKSVEVLMEEPPMSLAQVDEKIRALVLKRAAASEGSGDAPGA